MKQPCNCNTSTGSLVVAGDSGALKAIPDIAGIGVLVGLILPALIVFVLLAIYYFSALEAVDDGEMCTGLDKSFLDWVRSKQNSDPKTAYEARKRHRRQLETIILGFSDAQLVNAFSLLLSEFTKGCAIDTYHWQLLVQCIWFASATHLATIPILKAKLYDAVRPDKHGNYQKFKKSAILVCIRATLMTMILAMLVASLVPTGHPLWLWGSHKNPHATALPALCFFDYNFLKEEPGADSVTINSFNVIWLCWSIGLVAITYIKRLCELCRPLAISGLRQMKSRWPRVWRAVSWLPGREQVVSGREVVKNWTSRSATAMDKLHSESKRHPFWFPVFGWTLAIPKFLWHGLAETVRTAWRLLESFFWHIFWLFMMMAWNLYLLIYNQWLFHDLLDDEEGGDQEWSFGQIMPLLLLILPMLTIAEALLDPIKEEEDEGPLASPQVQPVTQRPSASDEDQEDGLPSPQAHPVPQPSSTFNGLELSRDSESTRITAFLMFEFALVFALLAGLNSVTIPSDTAKDLGYGLVIAFLACLVAAPLIFAYTIHIADVVTTCFGWDMPSTTMQLFLPTTSKIIEKKTMWLRSSIAVIVALAIGFAIVMVSLAAFAYSVEKLESEF